MNESIDLTKILKDCPKGTEFYSTIWGKMFFELIVHHPDEDFPVRLKNSNTKVEKNILGAVTNSIIVIFTEAVFSKFLCMLFDGIEMYTDGIYNYKYKFDLL